MSTRRSFFYHFAGVALLAGSAQVASAQHFDVAPRVEGGIIVTDGHDDGAPPGTLDTPNVRVFGYDFGEVPGQPYVAGDPGFNAADGGGLTAGGLVGFNILSGTAFGLPSNLTYWDGTGSVNFGLVPTGQSLTLNLGASNRTAGLNNNFISGFNFDTVDPDGSIHVHLNSLLNGSDGNADPDDGFPPADGIYLIPIELKINDPAISNSLPLFIVYNNGLTEELHDEAIDFVNTNVVPEPGSLAIAGVAGLMALRRRRREHHV